MVKLRGYYIYYRDNDVSSKKQGAQVRITEPRPPVARWWWWWWWCVVVECRTRGEEDVAWPGSKWKLLKPLSPRANERSLSRLPGWDPGRKCQRSTAPNRSIYTKNLPSSRYLAPMPINRARVSLDGSLSRVVSIYCVLVSFLSYFLIYFFLPLLLHFFPLFHNLFYETRSLSLTSQKKGSFPLHEGNYYWIIFFFFFFNWNLSI